MVFKAYDIRGEYPSEVNEELYSNIGKSTHILGDIKKVVVGRDMRLSSSSLSQALIEGLIEAGIDVVDIGLASTPMLYHATGEFDVDLGIIITASHNPSKDNGMKLCKKNAVPISWDSGIRQIKEVVENKDFKVAKEKGSYIQKDFKKDYMRALSRFGEPLRELNVVFDAGNAMGGYLDADILDEFAKVERLYCDLDGTFPNHEANPIKEETLTDLKKKVIETKADVGFAIDGDADRLGLVDEKGQFVPADLLAAFLTSYYMKKFPKEEVYSFDLRSSKILQRMVEEKGKTYVKTRVGHSFIKESMREHGSFFSCELSGHYYFWFSDDVVYDSAIRTALEVINVLSQEDRTLSECIEEYRVYYKSPETNFSVENKQEALNALKEEFSTAILEEIDGLTFNFDLWWFNVRASNTENKLRVNFEAEYKETYEEKFRKVCDVIEQFT